MEPTYNFNALWKAYSQTGNETLQLSVYQGTASLVMFRKGSESRRPVVKMSLGLSSIIKLADILKILLDAQPDTRAPFVQMNFNKETRTHEPATNFVFFKDDKRCYGVEISNKLNPVPVKIMFKCPNTFSTGSEAMTDEQKSVLGVRELITWLENMVTALFLSRWNVESMNQKPKPNGQNGGYQRRSGSQDPYSGAAAGSDDIFSA